MVVSSGNNYARTSRYDWISYLYRVHIGRIIHFKMIRFHALQNPKRNSPYCDYFYEKLVYVLTSMFFICDKN